MGGICSSGAKAPQAHQPQIKEKVIQENPQPAATQNGTSNGAEATPQTPEKQIVNDHQAAQDAGGQAEPAGQPAAEPAAEPAAAEQPREVAVEKEIPAYVPPEKQEMPVVPVNPDIIPSDGLPPADPQLVAGAEPKKPLGRAKSVKRALPAPVAITDIKRTVDPPSMKGNPAMGIRRQSTGSKSGSLPRGDSGKSITKSEPETPDKPDNKYPSDAGEGSQSQRMKKISASKRTLLEAPPLVATPYAAKPVAPTTNKVSFCSKPVP